MIILRGKTADGITSGFCETCGMDGSGMLFIPDSIELPDAEDECTDEFVKELIEYMSHPMVQVIRNKEG